MVREQDYTESAFGSIELGTATVKYVGPEYHDWSTCNFLLKQFPFKAELFDGIREWCHHDGDATRHCSLQFAKCYAHTDFVILEFYGSPCARANKRVVSENMKRKTNAWGTCCALSF